MHVVLPTSTRGLRVALVVALAVVAVALAPRPAFASPPANDFFANAQPIASLPFSDSGDLLGTGTEGGEPQFCNFQTQSVWYSFTPSSTTAVRIDLNGSAFGVVANVYSSFGSGIFSLGFNGCMGFGGSMQLTMNAGTTYYVQAGSVSFGPAQLQLHVSPIPPPANDDFANATVVPSLPFTDSVDRTSAGMEPSERVFTSCGQISHTVWYAYTPSADGFAYASGSAPGVSSFLAVYTGGSLADLVEESCAGEHHVFGVKAGTTYYIQVGSYDGQNGATQSFSLTVAPLPNVTVFVNPRDPSTFDANQFSSFVFDPAASGFVKSERWDFGDGASADGTSAAHRYDADGQYTATATVTMSDGRVATGTGTVIVKTHDVAVSRFAVPQTAAAGQTKMITVSVSNSRYPETVQVTLSKSVGGGFADVGYLTLSVKAGKPTDFAFSYVFTDDDASIGKVSFRATASILGARDALPADNSITALATRVK